MDASVSRWSVDVARFAVKTSNKNSVIGVSKVGEFVLRGVCVFGDIVWIIEYIHGIYKFRQF